MGQVLLCLCMGPFLDSTEIHLRSKAVGSKNTQAKKVFLFLARERVELTNTYKAKRYCVSACFQF